MRKVYVAILIGLAAGIAMLGCNDNPTECCDLAISNAPSGPVSVFIGQHYQFQFAVSGGDNSGQASWTVVAIGDPTAGDFAIDSTGLFTFKSDAADAEGSFGFTITATDADGNQATATLNIAVANSEPGQIGVEHRWVHLGQSVTVPISKYNSTPALGNFQLLVAFPVNALTLQNVRPGQLLLDDGWEKFDYEFAGNGLSKDGERLQFVRIAANAEDSTSSEHPLGYLEDSGQLALLDLTVSSDTSLHCTFVPIEFVWLDCHDNSFTSSSADTTFISLDVYDWRWGVYQNASQFVRNDSDCEGSAPFTFGGACPECETSMGSGAIRFMNFKSGSLEPDCYEEFDRPGDMNLNGIDNEIADLILYAKYFLEGESVFIVNKPLQIAESDVNNDGYFLTVGDMTYLDRIITGDARPFPHLKPFSNSATVWFNNGTLTTLSDAQIAAIWAQIRVTDNFSLSNLTDMELKYNQRGNTLYILVWSGTDNLSNAISSGTNDIFDISGGGEMQLLYLEASDYDGNLMNVLVQTPEGVVTFDKPLSQ